MLDCRKTTMFRVRCLRFCSIQFLVLKEFLSLHYFFSTLSLFFVFCFWFQVWMCDGILVWFCSIQQLCCFSHYIQYHSLADYIFLYLLLVLILSCFCVSFSFLLRLCLIAPSFRLVSLLRWPLALFSLPLSLTGSIPCFPSPPNSLYEYFHQNIPSPLNLHLLLPNNPQSISHKLHCFLHCHPLILAFWRVVFLHCHAK